MKEPHYMEYRLLSGIKNDFILKFSKKKNIPQNSHIYIEEVLCSSAKKRKVAAMWWCVREKEKEKKLLWRMKEKECSNCVALSVYATVRIA